MNRAFLIALCCVLSAVGVRAATLELLQEKWGFDGTVVPGRINILSVEVRNPSSQPFDGILELYKGGGVGIRYDAPLVERCFISPGARRWVQFYPYVRHEHENWVLEWALGPNGSRSLKRPKLGPPARVFLRDPESVMGLGSLPHPTLDDNLFPPTVAATDGLQSVLLDHAPRWEPVRREAFLDWLRRGGEVHLLLDRAGRHPVFTGELAVLNSTAERHRVGAGLVTRHEVTGRDADEEALATKGYPAPTLKAGDDSAPGRIEDMEGFLFHSLGGLTRPRHSWGLIYLTTIAYVVLLGPLNFLYARKRRDYRLSILFFFLCVAGCALALHYLGRRGQNEATAVHYLACARHIEGDSYDVTQWADAFVTRGAIYDITHDAPHNLYSACEDTERVRGQIANGLKGVFRVDIPVYSRCSFLHRGKLKGHHIQLKVAEWKGEETLERLVLEPAPGFPEDPECMFALHRDTWYDLALRGGKLEAVRRSGPPEGAGVSPDFYPSYGRRRWGRHYGDEDSEVPAEKRLARLAPLLCAREAGGHLFGHNIPSPPGPKDRVRVFIFTRCPETFDVQGRRFGRRLGFVLYSIGLWRPEDRNG